MKRTIESNKMIVVEKIFIEFISMKNDVKIGKEGTDSFRYKFRLLALFICRIFEKAACDKSDRIGSAVEE